MEFQWILIVLLLLQIVLFCCERDFMSSLSDNNQAGAAKVFNSISRYLDD